MCEAYANGAIGTAQIATFLGRSQDLTAVILAVEQLTGAVAANQVVLTGTTSASASASLLSNQDLLDSAREDETEKQAKLEEAKAELATAKETRDKKENEEAAAKNKRDRLHATDSTASEQEKAEAQSAWERSQEDLQLAQREVDAAENMVETRRTLLEESRRNRETIENARDSALTSAAAGTTSSGQFSVPVARKELSKEATAAIAKAVERMVVAVLRKEYTEDSCMAMVTTVPRDYAKWSDPQRTYLMEVRELCREIILKSISARYSEVNFGIDDSTDRIDAWLKSEAGNRARLAGWLRGKNLDFSVTSLLFGAENADLRRLAIIELSIP
jgi:hypothetical protein